MIDVFPLPSMQNDIPGTMYCEYKHSVMTCICERTVETLQWNCVL